MAMVMMVATIALAADTTAYVAVEKTSLYRHPFLSAQVEATMAKGIKLTVHEAVGPFLRVTASNGKKGYILAERTTKTAPGTKSSSTATDDPFADMGDMQRTAKVEDRSSSHSIRGLKLDDEQAATGTTEDEAARSLSVMESNLVNDNDQASFEREGKVGRYAR
jgi:uncharacterized protein YgiM (DUF1202 family)